ncbi:anti-sigma factor [Pseudomonas sp. PD9R]|uniref:anti-sigma factor family protein n=1 Tax=Pseudomonas sp. PD9R TaxID=2853534 RepID=UPI001C45C794|nr:anti-sigma factor [Pseudomonas sp. PD9R]MBV6825958.1 anti-sigma factor [Pseudomonas sp. PD9R]
MNELQCTVCQRLMQGYLDEELDPPTAADVAGHLAGCTECARLQDQAKRLMVSVKRHAPYYAAPASLTASVFAAVAPAAPATRTIARWRTWFAPVFSAAALALAMVLYVATPASEQPLMDEAVSSHVRSLMGEHLNDVVSSDRHTVKPWFTGKLDFSPPVFDYATQGFPLLGGRLDYLQHQTTAALSYGRNKHIINVFILPTQEADKPPQSQAIRGFNVVSWQENHMRFVLVSDVEKSELEAFSQLLKP